jgi:hypothetical protein
MAVFPRNRSTRIESVPEPDRAPVGLAAFGSTSFVLSGGDEANGNRGLVAGVPVASAVVEPANRRPERLSFS